MMDVRDLTLNYEEDMEPVLKDVSFSVNSGETVMLLGASGSGKSTLTRCLTGLYPAELEGTMTGDVYYDGKSVKDAPPGNISKSIGIVFQDPETQFCMLTVEDEVAFGLENLQVDSALMEETVSQALSEVGLKHKKKERITSLSGGEKQKLALACILAMNPPMIILDEPTSNLDPVATDEFVSLLESIKEKNVVTLFVIEHDLGPWVSLMDRTLMLGKDGGIIYDGPLRKGLERHAAHLKQEGIALPLVAELAMEAQVTEAPFPITREELMARNPVWERREGKSAGSEPALLLAEHVGWKEVLRDVDVSIPEGAFTAILGPNGSGKTTLSRVLSGITSPSSGSVHHPFQKKDLFRHIGYVFQNPEHQFLTDSVWEEVAYSGAGKERVAEMLKWCGLYGQRNLHPFLLSQGQKRRLSVATMLIHEQDILFLDEPTFGQDAFSVEQLMRMIEQKHQEGTTIVMVTHDMEIVDRYATHTIVLKDGEVGFTGTPEQLWEQDIRTYHLKRPLRVEMEEECSVPQ